VSAQLQKDRYMALDKNMSILVVDDQQSMRRIIINLLRQIGFTNFEEAADGENALTQLKSKKFQLILSDWHMEPMTGIDLLRSIRASNENYKNVPVILITAEEKVENILAAKQAGVNNYIKKPFSAEILKNKISVVMGDTI
jgi:two-component system, chemotaxis family, chemotaxis protein CheY